MTVTGRVLLMAAILAPVCLATTRMHVLHWNNTNPIFRIDNTDHIIDINEGNLPWEYDQVNIVCPVYKPDSDGEKYVIYNVSREEYDTCRITNPSPRVMAVCNKPHELMYFTITFRSFSPTPGGMEFKPGQDYYFISTSSSSDLHRRIGGHCRTHNMKVMFKVADNRDSSNSSRSINAPRSSLPASGTTIRPDEIVPESKVDQGYFYPSSMADVDSNHLDQQQRKRSQDYMNEVIKQEASRMKSSSSSSVRFSVLVLLISAFTRSL